LCKRLQALIVVIFIIITTPQTWASQLNNSQREIHLEKVCDGHNDGHRQNWQPGSSDHKVNVSHVKIIIDISVIMATEKSDEDTYTR